MSLQSAPHRTSARRGARCSLATTCSSSNFKVFGVATLLALAWMSPVAAQQSPNLGTAAPYAVLGTNVAPTVGTVTCTDTGPGTVVDGDVGTTFNGGITNTMCTITGTISTPVAATVVTDFNAAYNAIDAGNPCTGVIPITTTTLAPGVYCSAAGTTIGAGVIITLDGAASDTWVFRVGTGGLGALTLTNAQIVMAGAADACNVFWKTAEATTLTDSDFVGTVLSGAAITMNNGSWFGRALARTDVSITDAAPLTFAGCAAPAAITVSKDFSDNNPAQVLMGLSCTSGVLSASSLNAAEGAPAVFTVSQADLFGATCTATESVPVGYTADQSNCVGVALGGNCTIINTLIGGPNTITVNKDFSDNSLAPVSVSLVCTSGTPTASPLNASEGAPAVFEVTGASPGATCTATESVPFGYLADQSNCVGVALDGNCTIINTLIVGPNIITVNKDFSDNSLAPVSVSLVCASGTPTTSPLNASEGAPAVFEVTGASLGATCTATETVPFGYLADQANCVGVALDGSCTIINTLIGIPNTITVIKDFVPDSTATVLVALTCPSGNISATPLNASEAAPAVFTVTGAAPGTICSANEVVPFGYSANQTNCLSVAMGGSCTITNTLTAPPSVPVPSRSAWGMLLLAGLLTLFGLTAIRARMI